MWNVWIWTGTPCQIRIAECLPRYRWSCFSSLGVRDRVWETQLHCLVCTFHQLHHLVKILVSPSLFPASFMPRCANSWTLPVQTSAFPVASSRISGPKTISPFHSPFAHTLSMEHRMLNQNILIRETSSILPGGALYIYGCLDDTKPGIYEPRVAK